MMRTRDEASVPVKLSCDAMLHGLGRWLRIAGYDTAMVDGAISDADLIRHAEAEGRVLLTCDRQLGSRAGRRISVVVLPTGPLEVGARELRERLRIDWLHAPFTRCLLDNAHLRPAGPEERTKAPPATLEIGGEINVCPACGRVYWPGSHVRRMRAILERWRAESGGSTGGT